MSPGNAAWPTNQIVTTVAALTAAVYVCGVRWYGRRRRRTWPIARTVFFLGGLLSAVLAIVSPLDEAGDASFAAHMVQHLLLTNVAAPLVLLGAPLLLALASTPARTARRITAILHTRLVRGLASPIVCWTVFIMTLWAIHFSPFFELALDHEFMHVVEHALFIGTALWFWLPVIAIGPAPSLQGPLSFPARLLYVILAMPAEAFLGFGIYGARHVMYAHYRASGLADQQTAGEIMWIGSGFTMFLTFMAVGFMWSQRERESSV